MPPRWAAPKPSAGNVRAVSPTWRLWFILSDIDVFPAALERHLFEGIKREAVAEARFVAHYNRTIARNGHARITVGLFQRHARRTANEELTPTRRGGSDIEMLAIGRVHAGMQNHFEPCGLGNAGDLLRGREAANPMNVGLEDIHQPLLSGI